MKAITDSGLLVYDPGVAGNFDLTCGVSTKKYGNARDSACLERILSEFNITADQTVRAEQTHGSKIALVDKNDLGSKIEIVDGLITRDKGVCLLIFTADCLPVFLYSKDLSCIGLLHCGWRSLSGGIISKSLPVELQKIGARACDMHAILGPSIEPCCYKVKNEFWDNFPKTKRSENFDLKSVAVKDLTDIGFTMDSIHYERFCTCCGDMFYSYRKTKTDSRIVSFIIKRSVFL